MNIISLEIYGYGRLEQRKYHLNRPFTQIYGENETGKSTMQLFIHSILFGFPEQDEPKLLPRFATTYGGNLELELDGQHVIVERVYAGGKENFNVTVDGQRKDEAWFRQALNFMTKDTYRQIFSFDVLGLQQVGQLTADKLEAYLLQAGVFGSTEYAGLEEKLSEEKQQLLTDDHEEGKLSEHLLEITSLESQIREEQEKLESYELLQSEHYQLTERVNLYQSHIEQLTAIQQRKQKELMFHQDMKEWKQLELQLNIEPLTFPDHGLERYESLKHQQHSSSRDLALRQEKVAQLKKELAAIELLPDDEVEEVNQLLKEEAVIKQHHKTSQSLQKEMADQESRLLALQADVGWHSVHNIPLDESIKHQLIMSVADKDRLTAEINQLKRECAQAEEDLMHRSADQETLLPLIATDEEFQRGEQLYEQRAELVKKTELYDKLKVEQDRLAEMENKRRNTLNILYTAGIVTGLLLSGYFFYDHLYIPAGLSLLLPLLMIVLIVINRPVHSNQQEIMQQEITQLQQSVNALSDSLDDDFQLSRQRQYKADLRVLNSEIEANKRRQQKLSDELHDKETALRKTVDRLTAVKEQLHLTPQFEDHLLHHAYRTIFKIQQLQQSLNELGEKYIKEQQPVKIFNEQLKSCRHADGTQAPAVIFHELSAVAATEEKKRLQYKRVTEQLQLSEKELETVSKAADSISEEISRLFSDAGVMDESAYYAQYKAFSDYTAKLERHTALSHKLEDENFTYEINTELAFISSEDLRQAESELTHQLNELKNELQLELTQRQQIEGQLRALEEDTTLSELNYQYEIERQIVNRLAKEYGALNYIETLIASHRQQVKDERIPHIIAEAARLFKDLTEGRYIDVLYDSSLVVKHKDGQIYQPVELSQSTKELLYIAMRLSLIQHLRQLYPFPIIIDDAFVHFDRYRKDFVIDYMMNYEHNQVLYFTCNRTMSVAGKNTLVLERHDKEIKK